MSIFKSYFIKIYTLSLSHLSLHPSRMETFETHEQAKRKLINFSINCKSMAFLQQTISNFPRFCRFYYYYFCSSSEQKFTTFSGKSDLFAMAMHALKVYRCGLFHWNFTRFLYILGAIFMMIE